MPLVLVALFILALLAMLVGLFLTSRSHSQPDSSQGAYLVTPQRRRVVVSSTLETVTSTIPVRARASAQTGAVRQSVRVQSVSRRVASVAQPLPLPGERLIDRVGSWKVAVPGLMAIFLLGFYLFSLLIPHPLLWMTTFFNRPTVPTPTATAIPHYGASQDLVRLNQLDPAQYQSTAEFNTWAYSACSAAAMTEVINSYGHTYRVTDILNVESEIHEITPDQGLLEESGIQHTGTQFHFNTVWGHNLSLDQVIAAANNGTPVIVSFPPDRYAGGHLLVVRGGDQKNVILADSSLYNRTTVTRAFFLGYWEGFYAIMTPA